VRRVPDALDIDPDSGCLRIAGLAPIRAGADMSDVANALTHHAAGERDHGNGYAWLYFRDLSFGGRPCHLALCFLHGRLAEAGWSVALPDAAPSGEWPTREAIDEEIAFVRAVLGETLGRPVADGHWRFQWGEIWSAFDPKGFLAANGLRYR
jgi:hypothetical protein